MNTQVDQIADRIYRISTLVPEAAPGGFSFNQFLIDAEEPLLFHTGMRQLFPLVRAGIEQVMPIERLRWISFCHVEADECGAMNDFLAAAPEAQVAHGVMGCMVSLNDMADRPPRPLSDAEVLELGTGPDGFRVREIATPHVPHNWESHMLFEEKTATLFCGDVWHPGGRRPSDHRCRPRRCGHSRRRNLSSDVPGPGRTQTLRRLADLNPTTLAIMHGSSYNGDCSALLRTMAEVYEQRYGCISALPQAV